MNGKFSCSDETYCILAGYVVQGEFGDYDPLEHVPGYLEDFPFLVSKNDRIREEVEKLHRKNRYWACLVFKIERRKKNFSSHVLTFYMQKMVHFAHSLTVFADSSFQFLFILLCRGYLPAECDRRFLDLACRLDRYGMDFHQVLVCPCNCDIFYRRVHLNIPSCPHLNP